MTVHTNVDCKSKLYYNKHTKGTKCCDADRWRVAKERKQSKPTDILVADSSIFCFKLICIHRTACSQF